MMSVTVNDRPSYVVRTPQRSGAESPRQSPPPPKATSPPRARRKSCPGETASPPCESSRGFRAIHGAQPWGTIEPPHVRTQWSRRVIGTHLTQFVIPAVPTHPPRRARRQTASPRSRDLLHKPVRAQPTPPTAMPWHDQPDDLRDYLPKTRLPSFYSPIGRGRICPNSLTVLVPSLLWRTFRDLRKRWPTQGPSPAVSSTAPLPRIRAWVNS